MKLALILTAGLLLSGCASVLEGVQKCERHYDGTVAGGAVSPAVVAGKALIDCCPVGTYAAPSHDHCIPLPIGATVVPAQPIT